MDNRELNLAIPETRAESLASGDGIDAEDEDDESEIEDTIQYVTCNRVQHGLGVTRRYTSVFSYLAIYVC